MASEIVSPQEFGELGELALELNGRETLTREDCFDAFLDWCSGRGIELWPHQEEALMALMMGDHVVLGMPTRSRPKRSTRSKNFSDTRALMGAV